MKRLFALILAVVLLPVFSLAEDSEQYQYRITEHYSLLIDGRSAKSSMGTSLFDFDSLCIDLYITESSETAYLCITTCKSYISRSSGLQSVSIQYNDGKIYFTDKYGFYLTGHKDEGGDGYWIDYIGRSYRLHPVAEFSVYGDWE